MEKFIEDFNFQLGVGLLKTSVLAFLLALRILCEFFGNLIWLSIVFWNLTHELWQDRRKQEIDKFDYGRSKNCDLPLNSVVIEFF